MVQGEALQFLKTIPPFSFLESEDLQAVVSELSLEYYPRGTVIVKQGSKPSDVLRIIKKGGVKLLVPGEKEQGLLMDYRGEGETFGFLSIVSNERIRSDVVAAEDTLCYLLGKATVLKLFHEYREVAEYFFRYNVTRYVDRTAKEIRATHGTGYLLGTHRLFTTPVGEICSRDLVSVPPGATIREAARRMKERRISCILVMEAAGEGAAQTLGVVSDRDLREKVVADGRSSDEPVSAIMSPVAATVDIQDSCFEAIVQMVRHGVRHVLVTHHGKPLGMLTNHDLVLLQGQSPISLISDIEAQGSLSSLIPLSGKVNAIAGLLLNEGAKASQMMRVFTEINDRLVRRIVELAEESLGAPPVPYCWVAFGSEGRKEQTFKTDQDNALIYEDPADEAQKARAEAYFQRLSELARDSLVSCGFPLCPGNYMASNPQWRKPLGAWKQMFRDWIELPSAEALLHSVTLFDFRPIAGDHTLAQRLRGELTALIGGRPAYLGTLANFVVQSPPPVGFLRSFVVEKSGAHKDELNLKISAIAPLVDLLRLGALEKGIEETPSLDRLAALRKVHTWFEEVGEEFEAAFEFLSLLRIHHQYELISKGKAPDNFINPAKLSHLERRSLKEAFQLIGRAQGFVRERYKGMIW